MVETTQEQYYVNGEIDFHLYDSTGKLKEHRHVCNRVVMTGCELIASALVNNKTTLPSHIAIGKGGPDGTVAPELSDIALQGEVIRKPFDEGFPKILENSKNSIVFTSTFGPNEPTDVNTPITEVAIFNADSEGVMLNRSTFAVVNKNKDDTLRIDWTVTIVSSSSDIQANNA